MGGQLLRRHPTHRLVFGVTAALLLGLLAMAAIASEATAGPAVSAAAGTADEPCEPFLVAHRPDGSEGETRAVFVTAQVLEAGVEGWDSVTWDSDEAAELTGLSITRPDGSIEHGTDVPSAGTEPSVSELRFCGTLSATGLGLDGSTEAGGNQGDAGSSQSEDGGNQADAEVRGIQLARADEPGRASWIVALLTVLAGGTTIGAGTAVYLRRRAA